MQGKILSIRVFSLMLILGFFLPLVGTADTNITAASPSANAFVIRYCTHDNYTGNMPYVDDEYLFIYSNGTATYQYTHSQWSSGTSNRTSQLSAVLISKLHETLLDDEFMSLNQSYTDLGWFDTKLNHTERVCIEVSGGLKTVTFYGRSMMGTIPSSYALLNNIAALVSEGLADLPDASLEVIVTEDSESGPLAKITANFTNNGDTTLQDSGLCSTSWPTYIVSMDGGTVGDMQARIAPYCTMQFAPHTTTHFGPWEWNRTDIPPGTYVIMSRVVIWDYVIVEISPNSTWTPANSHSEQNGGQEGLSLAIAGLGIAFAVGVTTFFAVRMRKRER